MKQTILKEKKKKKIENAKSKSFMRKDFRNLLIKISLFGLSFVIASLGILNFCWFTLCDQKIFWTNKSDS